MPVTYCSAHVGFRRGCVDCRRAAKRYKASGRPVMVAAVGAGRRLRALAAVGWSLSELAEVTGVSASSLAYVRASAIRVQPAVHAAVCVAYEHLAMQVPGGRGPTRTRAHAARKGWPPPLAWDDDTIDDPSARPCGLRGPWDDRPERGASRAADIAGLAREGLSDREIGVRLGMSRDAVAQSRHRHGIRAGRLMTA